MKDSGLTCETLRESQEKAIKVFRFLATGSERDAQEITVVMDAASETKGLV